MQGEERVRVYEADSDAQGMKIVKKIADRRKRKRQDTEDRRRANVHPGMNRNREMK